MPERIRPRIKKASNALNGLQSFIKLLVWRGMSVRPSKSIPGWVCLLIAACIVTYMMKWSPFTGSLDHQGGVQNQRVSGPQGDLDERPIQVGPYEVSNSQHVGHDILMQALRSYDFANDHQDVRALSEVKDEATFQQGGTLGSDGLVHLSWIMCGYIKGTNRFGDPTDWDRFTFILPLVMNGGLKLSMPPILIDSNVDGQQFCHNSREDEGSGSWQRYDKRQQGMQN